MRPLTFYKAISKCKNTIFCQKDNYITVHKDSVITNYLNHSTNEECNPKYSLDFLLGIINVGVHNFESLKDLQKMKF